MSAIVDFWKTIVLPHVPYFIRHDFWRKLFALVFAGMLTVVAYQNADAKIEMEETDFRNVPVRFTTAEKGVTLTPYDISVAIRVEVPKKQKGILKNTDFSLECPVSESDIANNKPLDFTFDMVKPNRPIDHFSVKKIEPNTLVPDIDIVENKDVPVEPVYDLKELMEGYDATVLEPEKQVTVRGPKKLLDTVETIETEKIPLANVTKSFSRQVNLIPPYDRNIEILSGKMKVEVRIEKKTPLRFDGIPVQVLFGRTGANNLIISRIQPETVTVRVDNVPDISRTQIHPFLDLSDVTRPGVYNVDIKCWSDNDRIKVVEVIPAKATVTLEPVVVPASK